MKNLKMIVALFCVAKLNYTQAQNLQNGLQACYPMDCNVTNMAATGSILDGIPVGVTCATGVSGGASTAYAFAGTVGSYISLPNNALIKPNAISFSGWVKFNNIGVSQYIAFAKNPCTSFHEGYAFSGSLIGGNFRLQLTKSNGNCSSPVTQQVTGATNLSANVWYHVGFYSGPDSLKVYLNGVADAAPIASTFPLSYGANNVILGGTNVTFNLPFNGVMDNVRFYNRKLTYAEFNLLYTTIPACNVTGEPLLTDSLQACYPLDCNTTNMAATGSALNGIPSFVSCATDRFGNANGCYQFGNSPTSFISLPNDSRIKPTTRISFSGWVRFNTTTNAQIIVFTKNICSTWFEGYQLAAVKVGGFLKLQLVKSSSACFPTGVNTIVGPTTLNAGSWYHVGFYAGTDSLKMFLNGIPEGTPIVSTNAFSYDNTATPASLVYLGGTNSGLSNAPLDGRLDDIRFYNRKVYNFEFKKFYNSSPSCSAAGLGLTNGLQACYPLNCNVINYAPATTPYAPPLDGIPVNVTCDTGHVGNLNGAYKFAGNASSYIELPNDPRIKPNAISVSLWAKLDVLNSAQYLLFAKNTCPSWFEGYALVAANVGGQIRYQVAKSSSSTFGCGTSGVLNSTGLYSPYAWHHIAFYMDNSVLKLYVDGAAAGTLASAVTINYDNTKVYLGGTNQSFNYPLNGSIDNVRIYNRELVLSEFNAIRTYDPGCDVVSVCGGDPSDCREAVTTGLKKDDVANTRIELYPNPSSGKLYISNAKDKSLVIYDLNGKVVQHSVNQLDETTGEINIMNTAAGLYFVRIIDAEGNSVQTSKIILTR